MWNVSNERKETIIDSRPKDLVTTIKVVLSRPESESVPGFRSEQPESVCDCENPLTDFRDIDSRNKPRHWWIQWADQVPFKNGWRQSKNSG